MTFLRCCQEFSCLASRLTLSHYLLWLQYLASSFKLFAFCVYKNGFPQPKEERILNRTGSAIFVVMEQSQFTIIRDFVKVGQNTEAVPTVLKMHMEQTHAHTHTPWPYFGNVLFLNSVVRQNIVLMKCSANECNLNSGWQT